MWRAVEGEMYSAHGYLLSTTHIVPKKGKPFDALIVHLLTPTFAYDREGELVRVEKGAEILIPVTATLQKVAAVCEKHRGKTFEFFIRPRAKVDIGAGQTMWTYDTRIKIEPVDPKKVPASAALLATARDERAGAGEEPSNSDIPF
jgi:hypothetical protein